MELRSRAGLEGVEQHGAGFVDNRQRLVRLLDVCFRGAGLLEDEEEEEEVAVVVVEVLVVEVVVVALLDVDVAVVVVDDGV